MSAINSDDPDFRVCQVSFEVLIEMQLEAQAKGFATRWSSVEALCGQVKNKSVVLRPLLREMRGGELRAYRCLIIFSALDGTMSGGITTFDIDPARLNSLNRVDRDEHSRHAFSRMFALATGGISMLQKE